ncbi:MAG: hypothetical protein KJP24_06795 [Sulfurovum sp.]|nr:hypothetical protein [Sulfurovum sp.]
MKIAIIGAGKWGLAVMVRILSKAQHTTLPLWQLQQLAHMTSHIGKVLK